MLLSSSFFPSYFYSEVCFTVCFNSHSAWICSTKPFCLWKPPDPFTKRSMPLAFYSVCWHMHVLLFFFFLYFFERVNKRMNPIDRWIEIKTIKFLLMTTVKSTVWLIKLYLFILRATPSRGRGCNPTLRRRNPGFAVAADLISAVSSAVFRGESQHPSWSGARRRGWTCSVCKIIYYMHLDWASALFNWFLVILVIFLS